jgi:hypothetical protein
MLDQRLTQSRNVPLSPKICAESIDALESELAQLTKQANPTPEVENRMVEIMPELDAWKQESRAAETHRLKILHYIKRQKTAGGN